MKKYICTYILSLIIVSILILVLSTCASVKSQGINYFVGRSESDLINHFGYNGVEVDSSDSEYDRILFFTNRRMRYQMNKTNIVRYKVSRQTEIINLAYLQFSDGCVTFNKLHIETDGFIAAGVEPRVIHRNDNAILAPRITEFNNLVNRSNAFPTSQRDQAFNRSNIGDTYFLYVTSLRQYYSSGVRSTSASSGVRVLVPSETYTSVISTAWRVDIVAEDRPETESWIVAIYDERFDRWLSGNGNTIITQERANVIINEYINNGFTRRVVTEGHSMNAYIKNGKIIRVEQK